MRPAGWSASGGAAGFANRRAPSQGARWARSQGPRQKGSRKPLAPSRRSIPPLGKRKRGSRRPRAIKEQGRRSFAFPFVPAEAGTQCFLAETRMPASAGTNGDIALLPNVIRLSYHVDMSRHMDAKKSQAAFAALAQPTRLKAFRKLIAAHPDGLAGRRNRSILQGAAQHHVHASRRADARRADRGRARRPLDELPRQPRRLPRAHRLHAARLLRRPSGYLRAGGRRLRRLVLRAGKNRDSRCSELTA